MIHPRLLTFLSLFPLLLSGVDCMLLNHGARNLSRVYLALLGVILIALGFKKLMLITGRERKVFTQESPGLRFWNGLMVALSILIG